jgi:hypothetical protein
MLKRIVISAELLKQLGYNLNEIALDFIKHKHIFFEYFYLLLQNLHRKNVLNDDRKLPRQVLFNDRKPYGKLGRQRKNV